MDATLEQFLRVNGPWGLSGILLFMLFYLFVRERKSTETGIALLTKAVDQLSEALDKHDVRVQGMEKAIGQMAVSVDHCKGALEREPRRRT